MRKHHKDYVMGEEGTVGGAVAAAPFTLQIRRNEYLRSDGDRAGSGKSS